MSDHKIRAIAACKARCPNVVCRGGRGCNRPQFDLLLGNLPAWWDFLPDGGEARRSAFADLLGRAMVEAAMTGDLTPLHRTRQAAGTTRTAALPPEDDFAAAPAFDAPAPSGVPRLH